LAPAPLPIRSLTSGNKKAVDLYLEYVLDQFRIYKIEQRTYDLLDMASKNPALFGEDKNSI